MSVEQMMRKVTSHSLLKDIDITNRTCFHYNISNERKKTTANKTNNDLHWNVVEKNKIPNRLST